MLEEINGQPKTYRITCVDGMTERYDRDNQQTGFLVLNLEQDQYNQDTDNGAKMLCNYDEPKKAPDTGDVAIKYTGDAKVRICGRGKVFHATRDGKPYAGCVWTIQPDESMLNEKVYFANSTMWDRVDGDSCRVSAVDDKTLNGHTVTLTVQAPDGNSQDSVVIKVVDA